MTRTAIFHARPGHGAALAERLLHAASLVAEEIYVALSGTGRITVDDDAFELQPLKAVRVAAGSTRELEAGPQGLEVLASGSHSPGDGEMVAGRQRS